MGEIPYLHFYSELFITFHFLVRNCHGRSVIVRVNLGRNFGLNADGSPKPIRQMFEVRFFAMILREKKFCFANFTKLIRLVHLLRCTHRTVASITTTERVLIRSIDFELFQFLIEFPFYVDFYGSFFH